MNKWVAVRRKGEIGVGVIIVIAVVALAVVAGGLKSSVPLPTGFTTLSLSSVSFQSSNQFFNQKLWAMTVAQGGLGQSATGTFTKAEITSKSGSSTSPASDFGIAINYNEQSCNYPIRRSFDVPVYKYSIKTWTILPFGSCDAGTAGSQCPNYAYYGKYVNTFTCFCIDAQKITGDVAYNSIDNPTIKTNSTITVTGKNGVTDSVNINTAGNSQGFFNGGNAYYIWSGDLLKGGCPSQAAYYAFYKDAMWKIGQASKYSDYKTAASSLQLLVGGVPVQTQVENAVNNVNYAADAAVLETPFADAMTNPGQLDGAVIKKVVSVPVTSPIYTFYVKADFLGVYQPVPSIAVDSATSAPFNTFGTIQAVLKNYGENGNANVWAECPSPFSYSGNNLNINVPAGGSSSVTLPITANVGVVTTQNCVVKSNDGFTTSSKTVSVTANPSQVCTIGATQCTADQTIVKCNDAGSAWELVKSCDKQTEECRYDTTTQIPFCAKLTDYCKSHPDDAQCKNTDCGTFIIPGLNINTGIPDLICMITKWWSVYGLPLLIIIGLLVMVIIIGVLR